MVPLLRLAAGALGGSRVAQGANRLLVSSRIGNVVSNPMVKRLAKMSGASKVPALDKTAGFLSRFSSKDESGEESSSVRNRRSSRQVSEDMQDNHEKAHEQATPQTDESVSILRIIASDISQIKTALSGGTQEEGQGLMDKLIKGVVSLSTLIPSAVSRLGTFLATRIGGQLTSLIAKIPGLPALVNAIKTGLQALFRGGAANVVRTGGQSVINTVRNAGGSILRTAGRFVPGLAALGAASTAMAANNESSSVPTIGPASSNGEAGRADFSGVTSSVSSSLRPAGQQGAVVGDDLERRLLDRIAEGESEGAGGYNAVYGKSVIRPPKPIEQMTLGEIKAWQRQSVNAGSASSAVGRYQFIRGTLEATQERMKLGDDQVFDRETQDRFALDLMNSNRRRGLSAWREGRASDSQFEDFIASQWASIRNSRGRGTYDGDGLNTARHTIRDVIQSRQVAASNSPNRRLESAAPSPTAMVRQAVSSAPARAPAPVVVAPTIVQGKTEAAVASTTTAAPTPVIYRNPDSPVRSHINSLIRVS